jgi:hypothetical protein
MSREVRITFPVPLISTSFRLAADASAEFTFLAGETKCSCSLQQAILFSRKIQTMIECDGTVQEVCLPVESGPLFPQFLANLTKRSLVILTGEQFDPLWRLTAFLEMTEIQDQILNESLALFGQKIGLDLSVEGLERRQLFQTYAKHLSTCTAPELAWIPSEFLMDIFLLRPHRRHAEDQFARLVLELIGSFGRPRELFRAVRFDDLTAQMMGEAIDKLGDMHEFTDQLVVRVKLPVKRLCRILHLTHKSGQINTFEPVQNTFKEKVIEYDLDFKSMTDQCLKQELQNKHDFLTGFDFVFIGGDEHAHTIDFTRQFVDQYFVPYYEQGGRIIFFHAAFHTSERWDGWGYFTKKLDIGSLWKTYQTAVVAVGESPILAGPFTIPKSIQVTSAHSNECPNNPKFVVFGFSAEPQIQPYYMQVPRIGLIQIGHSSSFQPVEWQLLVNAVWHELDQYGP